MHERMFLFPYSFGYSDKKAEKGKLPIGIYGNSFKSGSMRLGQDAIILSKSENEECVGMLSQTYLEKILAKQIIVPIISTKKPGEKQYILLSMSNGSTLCSWSLLLCLFDHGYHEVLITVDMLIKPYLVPWLGSICCILSCSC